MDQHEQYHLEKEDRVQDWESVSNLVRTDKTVVIKDFYQMDDIAFSNARGQAFARIGVSGSAFSVAAQQFLIGVTSLAITPTVGLPRPRLVGAGKNFIVKDEAGGAGTTTITVVSQGEETIDGASSSTITTNYGSKDYYTDGANWFTK